MHTLPPLRHPTYRLNLGTVKRASDAAGTATGTSAGAAARVPAAPAAPAAPAPTPAASASAGMVPKAPAVPAAPAAAGLSLLSSSPGLSPTAKMAALAKLAGLGGSGNDAEFESAFANLAHAYIKDKSPNLLKYEVGFQIIERRDDDRAVGIAGFLVGDQWLYVPILYIGGQLKGHELLYLKDQDLFVPLKENWVEYVLNRQPRDLGTSVLRNPRLHALNFPEVNSWQRSYKYSCSWPDEVKTAAEALVRAFREQPSRVFAKRATLGELLDAGGRRFWSRLDRDLQNYPLLRPKLAAYYDLTDLERRAQRALVPGDLLYGGTPIKQAGLLSLGPPPQPLRIEEGVESKLTSTDDLSAAQKEQLIRDGFSIDDQREHATDVYRVPVRSDTILTSPQSTGIYEVLVKEGGFIRCLVVCHPWDERGQHTGKGLVVNLDNPRQYFLAELKLILARPEERLLDYLEFWEKLPDAKSVPVDAGGYSDEADTPWEPKKQVSKQVFLGPRGQGTCPCVVEEVSDGPDGSRLCQVSFRTHTMYETEGGLCRPRRPSRLGPEQVYWPNRIVRLGGHRGRVTVLDDELLIPNGFRHFDLGAREDGIETPFLLGTSADLERFLWSKTAGLIVEDAGAALRINGQEVAARQTVPHLVRQYGLREQAAREVLQAARAEKRAEFRLKLASPYLPQGGGFDPGFPEPPMGSWGGRKAVTTQEPQEDFLPVLRQQEQAPSFQEWDQQGEQGLNLSGVMNALQSGRREILDTSMVGRLLRAVRDENIIDKFIPRMMAGMDATGRILLGIYWHRDKYEDRYGKADMPAIEDAVRNSFEAQGDVILQLKEDQTGETTGDLLAASVQDVAET